MARSTKRAGAPKPAAEAAAAPPQPPVWRWWMLLDRTAVLFLGVAVGVAIGLAIVADRRVNATTLVAAHAGGTPAAAQTVAAGPDCAAPFTARLLKTVAKGDTIHVGVFGDSFGEGIWAALYWTLPKSENYTVTKYAERATGFTRYQSQNLEDKVASDLATQPVDIAVISFGANDAQGIADGGHVYPLLSPGWKQAYGARVARYVALLRAQGAIVYWVGLPKMRNPEFDGQIAAMNDFYAGEMARLDVPFMPTEALSVDPAGQFNTHLPDPKTHEEKLMRANDGIHMTIAGYERITGPLVERIRAYVASSRAMAAATAPAGVKRVQVASTSGSGT